MAVFESAYDLGRDVYHVADDEPKRGIIVSSTFGAGGVFYRVAWGHNCETTCCESELSRKPCPRYTTG